jgi:hypothetical protein
VLKLKMLAMCAGLLLAVAANAGSAGRAPLIGRHLNGYFQGNPLLICEYAGARATFEILSENGTCAPYIEVL